MTNIVYLILTILPNKTRVINVAITGINKTPFVLTIICGTKHRQPSTYPNFECPTPRK